MHGISLGRLQKSSSAEENWEAIGRKYKEDILFTILDVLCAILTTQKMNK